MVNFVVPSVRDVKDVISKSRRKTTNFYPVFGLRKLIYGHTNMGPKFVIHILIILDKKVYGYRPGNEILFARQAYKVGDNIYNIHH